MKIKVSIQIIFKIMIIVLMIIYLPSYSHQNVKVFKAISTTEALQTSVPVTSSKKIHLYNTHQGEEYVGYNVKEGASYLKDCLTKEGYFCDVEQNDFENYKNALTALPFVKYFFNTMKIVIFSVLGILISCSLSAYGLTRVKWKYRDRVFTILMKRKWAI